MATHIELLDTVAVREDIPGLGLTAGEVGAVVEILGDGEAFEVEFCDNSGQTYGLYTSGRARSSPCIRAGKRSGYMWRPPDRRLQIESGKGQGTEDRHPFLTPLR